MIKIMMTMNFMIPMMVSKNAAKISIISIIFQNFLVGDELEGIEVAQMMDEKDQGLYGAANKHYGSLGNYSQN